MPPTGPVQTSSKASAVVAKLVGLLVKLGARPTLDSLQASIAQEDMPCIRAQLQPPCAAIDIPADFVLTTANTHGMFDTNSSREWDWVDVYVSLIRACVDKPTFAAHRMSLLTTLDLYNNEDVVREFLDAGLVVGLRDLSDCLQWGMFPVFSPLLDALGGEQELRAMYDPDRLTQWICDVCFWAGNKSPESRFRYAHALIRKCGWMMDSHAIDRLVWRIDVRTFIGEGVFLACADLPDDALMGVFEYMGRSGWDEVKSFIPLRPALFATIHPVNRAVAAKNSDMVMALLEEGVPGTASALMMAIDAYDTAMFDKLMSVGVLNVDDVPAEYREKVFGRARMLAEALHFP